MPENENEITSSEPSNQAYREEWAKIQEKHQREADNKQRRRYAEVVAASIVSAGTTRQPQNIIARVRGFLFGFNGEEVTFDTPKYAHVAEAAFAQADALLAEQKRRESAESAS